MFDTILNTLLPWLTFVNYEQIFDQVAATEFESTTTYFVNEHSTM